MRRPILPVFTASRTQVLTYLFGVCLPSIAFLVFLNASVSFVITARIGQHERVGDAVGTLGFADECVALAACAGWGVLSDRLGVRPVAVVGYAIVGVGLMLFVQARNVYPQLLLARLVFSLGGAATSTMVTAILPSITYSPPAAESDSLRRPPPNRGHHNVSPSISSELTITPARFRTQSPQPPAQTSRPSAGSISQLAGLVGMFTGLGALVALGIFLPLPARFQKGGVSPSDAVADSFYIVGVIALVVAVICAIGLRNLPGEDHKGWRRFVGKFKDKGSDEANRSNTPLVPYSRLLLSSVALGLKDVNIGLGYLAGFVARASSVGISLFIPLFVNAYFISSGLCKSGPEGSTEEMKRNCRRAYTLAASLTGVSQLVALLCAPLFGYLAGRYRRFNLPLLLAAFAGMVGYVAFGLVSDPDPSSPGGSPAIFLIVALLGVSQIGAIVCSLSLLARGIQNDDGEEEDDNTSQATTHANGSATSVEQYQQSHYTDDESIPPAENGPSSEAPLRDPFADGLSPPAFVADPHAESSPLLPSHLRTVTGDSSRAPLKGSIAGVYSLAGGVGILLLTKVGGALFDETGPGAPFFMLAGFNGILLAVGMVCAALSELRKSGRARRARVD